MLDTLPLTANGKVDRRALPAPDQERLEVDGAFLEPQTPTERLIAEIWQEVLGINKVGRHDNFFDLGGHSLLSMQVIARLQKAIGLRITPREIMFQALAQLATVCEEGMNVPQQAVKGHLIRRLFNTIKSAVLGMTAHR